ncbi:HepT-like ribonuclease domain-containing protein [Neorhizobium sp. NPDC001467]|uniref:HepT-like ribonuclease domain-containing protein n=1 Tax=Neorhizobium sp. NPDC001467 TaxID=3390595 RepID=UPI003D00CAB5
MAREFRHFLHDIPHAITAIETAVTGKTFEDFQNDTMLKFGVERAIEIISEASRHIPDDLRSTRPEVPWPKVRGIGNVLRHEYHGLSGKIIWTVIEDEIPKLRVAIEAIQREVGPN